MKGLSGLKREARAVLLNADGSGFSAVFIDRFGAWWAPETVVLPTGEHADVVGIELSGDVNGDVKLHTPFGVFVARLCRASGAPAEVPVVARSVSLAEPNYSGWAALDAARSYPDSDRVQKAVRELNGPHVPDVPVQLKTRRRRFGWGDTEIF